MLEMNAEITNTIKLKKLKKEKSLKKLIKEKQEKREVLKERHIE